MRWIVCAVSLLVVAQCVDAQQLAFIRDRDVFAGNVADGKFRKIARLGGNAAEGDDLQISSDGKHVAYSLTINLKRSRRSMGPDFERYIEIAHLDGTNRLRLLDPPEKNAFGPLWSPDQKSVAFHCLFRSAFAHDLEWGIRLAGVDLKSSTPLQSPVFDHGFFVFAWTPKGELAVLGNDTLNIFTVQGERTAWDLLSVDTLNGTEFSPSSADVLSISPDGRMILWILTGADEGSKNFTALYEEDLYGIIMAYDVAAKTLRRISPMTIAASFDPPCWSPDGQTIYFCGIEAAKPLRKGEHPSTDLFRIHPDGTGLAKIATNAHAPVILR